ncbi:MAG: glycine cleavage system protein GcvH [Rhodospirillaceae bacterium]|nr:glycine cleavage system protein GcvH [Rhodospirillaceae bacterium]MDD9997431.1 glycine cleavage system protein GcvH [Rhodospirillaceae bacterium]MDE0363458.1 glycine cleavage system protein GcvH [Rhodospirillaceae bacterium]
MSEIPDHLRYTKDHEWIEETDDGTTIVGITDHAQEALGDLVFVELPEMQRDVDAGDVCAVVESVKAASDVYSPIAGNVAAVNTALDESPELVNEEPYGKGWLFRLTPASPADLEELLDAEAYERILAEMDG